MSHQAHTEIPAFPAELAELENALLRYQVEKGYNNYADLKRLYTEAASNATAGMLKGDAAIAVAYCGLQMYSEKLAHGPLQAAVHSDVNNLVKLIARDDNCAILCNQYDQADAVTGLLLTCVYVANIGGEFFDRTAANALLGKMTDKQVDPKALLSPENTVSELFGDAAWDLYSLDTVHPSKIAHHLYLHDIALNPKNVQAEPSAFTKLTNFLKMAL